MRLLRHKDKRATKGRSPYELWRDKRAEFVAYQSTQRIDNRKLFAGPYWATFVVNFRGETLFSGLFRATYRGLLNRDRPSPSVEGGTEKAGTCDLYDLTPDDRLTDLIGRLVIEWGAGALAFAQYAERNNKEVLELRATAQEEAFPGYLKFVQPLSRLASLPTKWKEALRMVKGVYLLTCPKTKEWYVGSAKGEDGFWGRWQSYIQTGHGGNVKLMSREPSDYQVSILEVAGSAADEQQMLAMEGLWQTKLQGMAMGLNKNWAGGGRSSARLPRLMTSHPVTPSPRNPES